MKYFISLLFLLSLWFLVSSLQLVSPLFLPSPIAIISSLRPDLIRGATVTLVRTLSGYFGGIIIAYSLHYFSLYFGITKTLDSQFAAGRSIPGVALMPLFILWFGFGEAGRIILILLTSTAYYIAPLHAAFQNIPRELSIIRSQLNMSKLKYYLKIVIPFTIPELLGALRITFAVCLTVAIASDYMGATVGIGRFIDSARVTYNIPGIFLALIVASSIGLIFDATIVFLHKKYVHWSAKTIKA